ncbi:hypothetical protein Bca52824_053461 [Brassica carinata]|uniref:Uncharacterized protein n=1 Tax=Brassica carinata TaxID=52824 RepID=A0A8X7ULR1_BRACI|nr:hypothetical protein Bca52824_053461 [Brassica carinata]
MGNLLKSKEVASNNEMQVGNASADVHTRMKLMTYAEEVPLRRELQYELAQMLVKHRAAVDPVGQGGLKEEIRDGLEARSSPHSRPVRGGGSRGGLKETPPSSPA